MENSSWYDDGDAGYARAGGNEARVRAHKAFDRLWRNSPPGQGRWAHVRARTWLAFRLDVPPEKCQIADMSIPECLRVARLCAKVTEQDILRWWHEQHD